MSINFDNALTTDLDAFRRVSVRSVALLLWPAVALLALRAPFVPGYLENHDAVNFALGLDAFDLTRHQPHFPGYPVYMALATLLHALGLGAPAALAWPGILAGAAAAVVLQRTLAPRAGALPAALATALYLALPGLWSADVTTTSDALGVHGVMLCLCSLLSGGRPVLTAAGLGLLLGVRAAYLPLALVAFGALFARAAGQRVAVVAAAGAGVLVWLVPLALLAGGPGALFTIGARFTEGHFTVWGGTAMTGGGLGRLTAFGGTLLDALGAAGLVLIAALAILGRRELSRPLLAIGAAYALWVLFGQNVDRVRHLLPLAPVLILLTAPAWKRGGVLAMALVAVTFVTGGLRAAQHATELPPALQAVTWVAQHHGPEQLQLYTGEEARLFQHYAPGYRAIRVLGAVDIERDLAEHGRPRRVLVSSGAGDLASLAPRLRPVAHFTRSRALDRPEASVTLYELTLPEDPR